MQKGIKIRLYPNKEQINKMNSFFGCRRYVYNYFLDYSTSNKDYLVQILYKKTTLLSNLIYSFIRLLTVIFPNLFCYKSLN